MPDPVDPWRAPGSPDGPGRPDPWRGGPGAPGGAQQGPSRPTGGSAGWGPAGQAGGSTAVPGPPGGGGQRTGLVVGGVLLAALLVLVVAVVGALALAGDDEPDTLGGGSGSGSGRAGSGDAVQSLEGVQSAVVQVLSQGTFVDPEAGLQVDTAGSGSGFFVDPSGLLVTNNHVVTGAGSVQVRLAGEDAPRPARVLAASECNDLALVQVDGSDFDYLRLRPQDAGPGVDVYAAGFPLGDPEYTLTRGIVSKAQASGATPWSDVDAVLEHDATINPGSSGGPLVTAQGEVVGVNYAGAADTGQFYAIQAPAASRVVDRLRAGSSFEWLGVNGRAISSPEPDGLSGVWVAAVESGSPGAEVGLRAGDLIVEMEGRAVGDDGTMDAYCEVLRSRGDSGAISISVLRGESGEVLSGTLNADDPLEVGDLPPLLSGLSGLSGLPETPETFDEFTTLRADGGELEIDVPVQWSQVTTAPQSFDDLSVPRVTAAVDLPAYLDSFSEPGLTFLRLPERAPDPDAALSAFSDSFGLPEGCPLEGGREDYDDGLYTGRFELRGACDGQAAFSLLVLAQPEQGDFSLLLLVQLTSEGEIDALPRILESFRATG